MKQSSMTPTLLPPNETIKLARLARQSIKVRHRWSDWGWYYKYVRRHGINLHYGRFCLAKHYGLMCAKWQDGVPPKGESPRPVPAMNWSWHDALWNKLREWSIK